MSSIQVSVLDLDSIINMESNPNNNQILKQIIENIQYERVEPPLLNSCEHYLQLDDNYIYDDIINSLPGEITNLKIIRNETTDQKYMCFKSNAIRGNERTLKQSLSDITTSIITQNMTDENYELFIRDFYTAMNIMIKLYIQIYKPQINNKTVQIPTDICFYYKGGNVFRILLNDIIVNLNIKDYEPLMKRSDADFQLYINPNIENYDIVYEHMKILTLYVLYSMKGVLAEDRYGFTTVFNNTLALNEYNELLNKNQEAQQMNLTAIKIEKKIRNDCVIDFNTLYEEEYVGYKNTLSVLKNIEQINISSFYISKNSAIKFKNNDILSDFDLIRLKMNYILNTRDKNGKEKNIPVPSEVIDISIPKKTDDKVHHFVDLAKDYLHLYTKEVNGVDFSFWAPSLDYMIHDVDDVLFIQREYPWYDSKYKKRIQRYLLCILVKHIQNGNNLCKNITDIQNKLENLITFLECINRILDINNTDIDNCFMNYNLVPPESKNLTDVLFYNQFRVILNKLVKLKHQEELGVQLGVQMDNMVRFNNDIIDISKNIMEKLLLVMVKVMCKKGVFNVSKAPVLG